MLPRNTESDLAQAMALHQARRYAEAELLYRTVLSRSPNHAQALCMLGALACETGRADAGVQLLDQASRLVPREAGILFNLARALVQTGRTSEAAQCYERVIKLHPRDAIAHFELGNLLVQSGSHERAVEHYATAVRLNPKNAQWHNALGVAHRLAGNVEAAIDAYQVAVRRDPKSAGIHYNLGIALQMAGRLADAVAAFEAASRLEPNHPDIQNNLGSTLRFCGRLEAALIVFQRGLALNADHAAIRFNLANTLVDLDRAEESLPHYRAAIALQPGHADFHAHHAIALDLAGHHDEANTEFDVALKLDHPDARYLAGLLALGRRNFAEGWDGYEYRWRSPTSGTGPLREFAQPRWSGESLQGQRLLIHAEQGLGDEIMLASIFPEIIREAAHCVIECAPKLEKLFRRSFPQATIVAIAKGEPEWMKSSSGALERAAPTDLQIAAGSLPFYRRRSQDQFPKHDGYLRADSERVDYWKSRLDALGPGLKIGLSWRGGTARTGVVRRSLPLTQLLSLLQVEGTHFISLQYTPCTDELAELESAAGVRVSHWQEAIDDYDETAALVRALDLTISVCTSVIHLAGALGSPVWVMAPRIPEWRYGREGAEMPWYPTVRIFRQDVSEEWSPVIEHVTGELRARVSRHS